MFLHCDLKKRRSWNVVCKMCSSRTSWKLKRERMKNKNKGISAQKAAILWWNMIFVDGWRRRNCDWTVKRKYFGHQYTKAVEWKFIKNWKSLKKEMHESILLKKLTRLLKKWKETKIGCNKKNGSGCSQCPKITSGLFARRSWLWLQFVAYLSTAVWTTTVDETLHWSVDKVFAIISEVR